MFRVYLRELSRSDAEALAEVLERNRAFLKPFEPRRPDRYFTVEGQREQIAASAVEREAGRACAFGIFEQQTDTLAGRITLSTIVRGAWQNANVGYWVDRARNGRGYATEALQGALSFAFDDLQLHRVEAAVMPRNVASTRVVEKNGFRREGLAPRYLNIDGRWEDHVLYGITREERR